MCEIRVIVPVYNVKKYLKRCIDSILQQSFEKFELILVDDGSEDGSGQLCDVYAEMDTRIKVIHIKNGGVSWARNQGLEIARGTYIIFCDSDDSWKPGLLEKTYKTIEEKKVDSVIFNYTKVVGNENIDSQFHTGLFEFSTDVEKLNYLIQEFMPYRHGYEVCFRLFRRDIIEQNHIRFCLTCNNFAEDVGFSIKYILFSKSIYCLEECYYNYYFNTGSMTDKSKNLVRLNELNEISYYVGETIYEGNFPKEYKKIFCILHFLLLCNQYSKVIGQPTYCTLPFEIEKIERKKWYKRNTRRLFFNYTILKHYFGEKDAKRILLLAHYCLHRNWKLFSIESYFVYNHWIKEH